MFFTKEKLFPAFLINRCTEGAVRLVFDRLEKLLGLTDSFLYSNISWPTVVPNSEIRRHWKRAGMIYSAPLFITVTPCKAAGKTVLSRHTPYSMAQEHSAKTPWKYFSLDRLRLMRSIWCPSWSVLTVNQLTHENLLSDWKQTFHIFLMWPMEFGPAHCQVSEWKRRLTIHVLSCKVCFQLEFVLQVWVKAAVYGDYSHYTSKPLKDFICKSNHGKDFFFVSTKEEAVQKLTETQ